MTTITGQRQRGIGTGAARPDGIPKVTGEYEPLPSLFDAAASQAAAPLHPDGNVFRHIAIRHGDPDAVGDVVVEGTYEIGMQDQAPLGTEAGLARPLDDGGVELTVAT